MTAGVVVRILVHENRKTRRLFPFDFTSTRYDVVDLRWNIQCDIAASNGS